MKAAITQIKKINLLNWHLYSQQNVVDFTDVIMFFNCDVPTYIASPPSLYKMNPVHQTMDCFCYIHAKSLLCKWKKAMTFDQFKKVSAKSNNHLLYFSTILFFKNSTHFTVERLTNTKTLQVWGMSQASAFYHQ